MEEIGPRATSLLDQQRMKAVTLRDRLYGILMEMPSPELAAADPESVRQFLEPEFRMVIESITNLSRRATEGEEASLFEPAVLVPKRARVEARDGPHFSVPDTVDLLGTQARLPEMAEADLRLQAAAAASVSDPNALPCPSTNELSLYNHAVAALADSAKSSVSALHARTRQTKSSTPANPTSLPPNQASSDDALRGYVLYTFTGHT